MKKMYFFGLLSSFFTLATLPTHSQGCMSVRSTGSPFTMDRPTFNKKVNPSAWTFTASNRYFKSFRHFVGNDEQKFRVDNGTEVVNKSYTLDLNAVRTINRRWSVSVNVPMVFNTRSSLYEHGGAERHTTEAQGLGDVRLTAYRWMLNPSRARKANFQAGLGVKLPTGDYKDQDYFYTATGGRVLGPVDQSIQPGDGGTGLVSEINAFYNLQRNVSLYSNLYYLVNPKETNGVSTARGGTPTATAISYGSHVMSVPDQYLARLGALVKVRQFTFSGGLRIDGQPVHDLVGGSNGFRRPGFIISAEPAVAFRAKRWTTFLNVPVALERNRLQSVPDKIRSNLTKTYYKGDAAFADYVVNLGLSYTIPSFKKKSSAAAGNGEQYYRYRILEYRQQGNGEQKSRCLNGCRRTIRI